MSDVTVRQLAEVVGTPVDRLLEQMRDAGISVTDADAAVSEKQKVTLLEFLRRSHGKVEDSSGKKITIKRKSVQELKVGGSGGKSKTVAVEMRKKRTYVKRDTNDSPPADNEPVPTKTEELTKKLEEENKTLDESRKAAEAEKQAGEKAAADTAAQVKADEVAAIEKQAAADAVIKAEADAKAAKAAAKADADAKADSDAKAKSKADKADAVKQTKTTADVPKAADATKKPADTTKPADVTKPATAADAAAAAKPTRPRVVMPTAEDKELLARHKKRKAEQRGGSPGAAANANKPAGNANANAGKAAAPGAANDKNGRGNTRYGRTELRVDASKGGRKKKGKGKRQRGGASHQSADVGRHAFEKPTAPVVREVQIGDMTTVGELAQEIAVKASEVIKALMGLGVMATINQTLDQDTAILVVEEMGHKVKIKEETEIDEQLTKIATDHDDREQHARAPVVTIMGHVDHGKTSLLDYIRSSRVVSGEAGGITQHIGAYRVETPQGSITFLDTPGHAAFTAMRARGAQVTDIVILVVSADDGVMPQTVEAVQHAKAAGVPLVVAVNKCDKPDADPERVRTELSQHEIISEAWGGENIFVNVSAHTGDGVEALLEAVSLTAELLELKAPTDGLASGAVVESSLDKGRGPVATILVQAGTIKTGDTILSGQEFGRVRALFDEHGKSVKSAGPSTPVQVLGLSGTPNAGDDVIVVENERKAREAAQARQVKVRENKLASQQAARLESLFAQMANGERSIVNVFLKADVQGSAEALKDSLTKISTDEVQVNVVAANVGGINESDVNLAVASGALMIGFNVRADTSARRLVEEHGVDLRYYNVIYDIIDDVRQVASGLLAPELREEIVGIAEVKDVFKSSAFGAVAGSLVTEGSLKRGNPIRVLRDNIVVFEGELESLRRYKDDVEEVRSGTECGIAVKNYNDVRPGDQIENFVRTEVQRTL